MTVQTSEQAAATRVAHEADELHGGSGGEAPAGVAALGAVLALPRTVKIIGGAAVGFGALLAVGVPLATLTPLVFLGGCLSMHLFMGHGMSHGGAHGSHDSNGAAPGAGSPQDTSTRTDA
jgi:hypothetical protein